MNYQKKVEIISIKGITKDLINKYKILKGVKYFSSGILQNYLVFISPKKYFKCFSHTTQCFFRGNLKERQKKVLKI